MEKFIELDEALKILDDNIRHLPFEIINLRDSLKRVLCEDVKSKINNPPFDKSVFDGYAFRAEDSKGASRDNFVELKLLDSLFAGDFKKIEVKSKEAVKIMTGAPIPLGANCVLKQEETERFKDRVKIFKELKRGDNIAFKGEDIKFEETLVKKEKRIDYSDLGIIASSGIGKLKVYKRPNISVISTGDELLDINLPLTEGKIYDSNLYTLSGRIEELGYKVLSLEHVEDEIFKIGEAIERAFKRADVVFTTGGVSVGDKDLMKTVYDSIGFKKLFWKIKIKPGSAFLCGIRRDKVLISLSGNPNAALVAFELLGRPLIRKLEGEIHKIGIEREVGILMNSFNKKSPEKRFLRGRFIYDEGICKVYITQTKSGNGILSSLLNSNCLIEVEKGNCGLSIGERVSIIKL